MRLNDKVFEVGADFLADGVYPVSVRAHVIKSEKTAMLDMGYPWHPETVFKRQLADYGIAMEDISLCLATHCHSDHVGGGPAFRAISGATVCMHKDDIPAVSSKEWYFDNYFIPLLQVIGEEKRIEENRSWKIQFIEAPITVDRALEDNDLFELGEDVHLRTYHMPGHSLGSVIYVWEEQGWAFCGDTITGLACESGDMPIITYPEFYGNSIRRMQKMDLEMLLLGHSYNMRRGPGINLKMGCYVKAYLEDSLLIHEETIAGIDKALRQHGNDVPFNKVLVDTLNHLTKYMWINVDYKKGIPEDYRVGSVHWVDTIAAYYAWMIGKPMSNGQSNLQPGGNI